VNELYVVNKKKPSKTTKRVVDIDNMCKQGKMPPPLKKIEEKAVRKFYQKTKKKPSGRLQNY
jgi:hypothetical protein